MSLRLGKGWVLLVLATTVVTTLGGLLTIGVQRLRRAAQRTSEI